MNGLAFQPPHYLPLYFLCTCPKILSYSVQSCDIIYGH